MNQSNTGNNRMPNISQKLHQMMFKLGDKQNELQGLQIVLQRGSHKCYDYSISTNYYHYNKDFTSFNHEYYFKRSLSLLLFMGYQWGNQKL